MVFFVQKTCKKTQEVLILSKKAYLTYPPPHWHSEEYSPMPDVRIFREVQQTLHDKSWQRHLVCLSVMSGAKEKSFMANRASRIVVSGPEDLMFCVNVIMSFMIRS